MSKVVAVVVAFAFCSIASAQVIFAPPDNPVPPDSTYQPLDAHRLDLLRALSRPYISIQVNQPRSVTAEEGMAPDGRYRFGPVIVIPSGPNMAAESEGIDPSNGQPLYFRMRDLLPEGGPTTRRAGDPEPIMVIPLQPPTTQPVPDRGRIIIKPYKPGSEPKLVSR